MPDMRALLKLACDLLSENRDEIAASYLVDDKLVFRDSVDEAARDRIEEIDEFIANAKEALVPSDPPQITEDWLKAVGFKWHEFERQSAKHWLLWCGDTGGRTVAMEDIGVEVAPAWWTGGDGNPVGDVGKWYVWLRSDVAGRYSRFLHVRHMHLQSELIALVEACTGQPWDINNHIFGSVRTPETAARIHAENERMDLRFLRDGHPWRPSETDPARGRPLIEHMEKAIETGKAK